MNQKSKTWRGRLLWLFLKIVAKPVVRLLWLERLEGKENLPTKGPYIIAANHQSYLDFILIMAIVPERVTFLAAEKFWQHPVWRPLVEYTDQIKVEREALDKSASIETALAVLKRGGVIALFPQGTRSRDGQIGRTFTGVARLALEASVPVVPIGLKGAFAAWPPNSRPNFGRRVALLIGRPFDFRGLTVAKGDRREERQLTNQIMQEIASLAELPYQPE